MVQTAAAEPSIRCSKRFEDDKLDSGQVLVLTAGTLRRRDECLGWGADRALTEAKNLPLQTPKDLI